jgi:hypothetical protein
MKYKLHKKSGVGFDFRAYTTEFDSKCCHQLNVFGLWSTDKFYESN